MPALAGSGPILGKALADAAASKDAAGVAAWNAVGNVLASWIPTAAIFNPLLRTPLLATGPVVTGTGGFTFTMPSSTLGALLASSAGSSDPVGQSRWMAIASAIVSWFQAQGGVDPSMLVAFVGAAPGAVTGLATLAFSSVEIGPSLASAAGSTDPVGIAAWGDIGHALLKHVTDNAQVLPGTLVNPGTGGPVTGASAIS